MKQLIKRIFKKKYQPLNIIEISKERLIDNYNYLSSLDDKIKIAPVLKSNAYSHGIKEVATVLDKLNPVFFCVDSLYEAYELLKSKIKSPILIMGYVDPENLSIKKLPFSYAVFDLEQFRVILKNQPQAKVHLFVDTGMHREGIKIDELEEFLKRLTDKEKNSIVGVMSHLALAEDSQNSDTKKQINHFKEATKLLRKCFIFPKYIHLGNSPGLLNNKKLKLSSLSNASRVGRALYGISSIKNNNLKQVLQLKTHIIQIKKIKEGEKVGYDFTYQAKKDGITAVLPIGFYDGVDRRLSNKGVVLIKNKICPIIGRVSMNLTVADVTSVKNIKVGDEVIVFSSNEDENNVVNTAEKIDAIPYEILVHLERSMRRKVV